MSRAFLPVQSPHHACMNEGDWAERNNGRMPASAAQRSKGSHQAVSVALRNRGNAGKLRVPPSGVEGNTGKEQIPPSGAKETPASRECCPAEQRKCRRAVAPPLQNINDISITSINKKESHQ